MENKRHELNYVCGLCDTPATGGISSPQCCGSAIAFVRTTVGKHFQNDEAYPYSRQERDVRTMSAGPSGLILGLILGPE